MYVLCIRCVIDCRVQNPRVDTIVHLFIHDMLCLQKRQSSLFYAVRSGNVELVEMLLLEGLELNVQDTGGFTPLHAALRCDHVTAMVQYLVSNGANLDLVMVFAAC